MQSMHKRLRKDSFETIAVRILKNFRQRSQELGTLLKALRRPDLPQH